jgi:membrane protease YdiL (CAAX protease family)
LAALVLYCGAGIYEELVFRGLLLGGLLLLFTKGLHIDRVPAAVCAALLAALTFAFFHYIGPEGDPFTLAGFVYRTLGGLYFSALFTVRGFGVAAACHAYYDILAGFVV